MRRTVSNVTRVLTGLILLTAGFSLNGAAPARRTIDLRNPDGPSHGPAASLLSHGIRTWGIGAARADRDRPAAGRVEYEDTSSTGPQAALLGVTRKISGTPMAGSVSAFAISPDGVRVVFIADKDTAGLPELYSVPAGGSTAPVKLSTGLPFGSGDAGVSAFQITPDSTRVVFLADPNTGGGMDEIFSAPIDASGAPVRLNAGGEAPVTAFGITPDGTRAVFFGVDTTFASGATEVFSALIGSASSAVQLSDIGQGNVQGNAVAADFSPDGARVIYAADATTDNVFQWYSVPAAATGPGSDVQLSAALSSVALLQVSPDSTRVVFTSDANTLSKMEIFSEPIGGGTRIKLNPSMAGDGVTAISIGPTGTRVAYLADQTTAGVNEVYGALIATAASGVRLNVPMTGHQYADTLNIGPDGITVLYEADQDTPDTYELFRVPADASAGPTALHSLTSPSDVGSFSGVGTPIIGRRVVYPVFGSTVDLFSVPYDGSASYAQVNATLAAGTSLFNAFLPSQATRLMGYGTGPSAGTATSKVFATPIRADFPGEQINVTAGAGALGVLAYEISSDQAYGVYLQDQDTQGKPELYSRRAGLGRGRRRERGRQLSVHRQRSAGAGHLRPAGGGGERHRAHVEPASRRPLRAGPAELRGGARDEPLRDPGRGHRLHGGGHAGCRRGLVLSVRARLPGTKLPDRTRGGAGQGSGRIPVERAFATCW